MRGLGSDGYLALGLDEFGFNAGAGIVEVAITEKGYRALGELPDPSDDLEARLDAIVEAIRARSNVLEEEKTRAETLREEAKTFGRGFAPAAAVQVARALAAQYGIPVP